MSVMLFKSRKDYIGALHNKKDAIVLNQIMKCKVLSILMVS